MEKLNIPDTKFHVSWGRVKGKDGKIYFEGDDGMCRIISDALNTHNTTGKTPSELMQERDELLEALREIKNAEYGTYKGTATYLKKVASDAIENFLTKHSTNV